MNELYITKPKVAIITLIQEGAAKIGGEHAMLFPYVEQIIKAAETLQEDFEIIPYVISPQPKNIEKLPQVEQLKEKMAHTNKGEMILVSNGTFEPYANPWNWEKYGYETNKAIIKIVKERKLDGVIVMAHGFASIPAILNMKASTENSLYGNIPIHSYFIAHSTFDEHKDNRPQRRLLEREIQNHSKIIAISPYMAKHLENIKIVKNSENTIPLYNALPEKGWFSAKVPRETVVKMIEERNATLNNGPFYGSLLPLDEILNGQKELVLYFGRAQKYVKGTDAIIAIAKNDTSRHYLLICSGSQDELNWHKKMLKNTQNVTLSWEHNSQFVLGIVQLTENSSTTRIYTLFLSRREPMGLVSREVILMQDHGTVLPVVSNNCGFDDQWQSEYSFVVTNPCYCEDIDVINNSSQLTKENDIFIHDECIKSTIAALNTLSKLSNQEIQMKVKQYKAAIKDNYSQNSYWSFYLAAIGKLLPKYLIVINERLKENNLQNPLNI